MPRIADGSYNLPDGTIARPRERNAFASDVATELNDSLSRSGKGGMLADLALASGIAINWGSGDVTVTHSPNTLTFAGASSGYTFDVTPNVGGTALVKANDTKLTEQADATWAAGVGTIPSIVAPDAIAGAIAALATSTTYSLAVQVHTSSETHTPTTGAVYSLVFCTGAGGGGGGDAIGGNGPGGGEGAGTAIKLYNATEMGASAAVTIGSSGSGGISGGAGSDGGDSTFDPAGTGATITGAGGDGGGGGTTNEGGAGEGTATNGDINLSGQSGFAGQNTDAIGGNGGGSFWGGGGLGSTSSTGGAGTAYGSGGGGGAGNADGGPGAAGVVFVLELVST